VATDGNYITKTDLDGRMTAAVVLRIFDDSDTGALTSAEETNLQNTILDGESFCEQFMHAAYGDAGLTALQALGTSAPRAWKRLCLDAAEIACGRRHPEYQRGGWSDRRTELVEDLKMLRLREVSLATTGEPEPACNEGGLVVSGNADDTAHRPKMWVDSMGDYS